MLVADDVGKITAPAMAPLISMEPLTDRGVGRALHGDIKGRIDPQAALVHGLGSIGGFKVFANLFHEVGRELVPR